MKLRPLLAMSFLTTISALRGKLLWAALILGLAAGAGARFFATASLGQDLRVGTDLVQAILVIGTVLLGITALASFTLAEQERGVIFLLRPKPLTTAEMIIGKFVGLWLAVAVGYWLAACLALLLLSWNLTLPWQNLLLSLLVSWGEITLVLALGSCFTALSSPLLALFLTVAFWFGGHSLDLLAGTGSQAGGFAATFTAALRTLLPNLGRYNLHETFLSASQLPVGFYVNLGVYTVAWTAILLLLAVVAFRQREW